MGGLIRPASVAAALRAEFPALALLTATVAARPRRTPPDVGRRLNELSDRWRGAQALTVRRQPVALAHRVFFRGVGIDPDVQRVPQEEAIVRRLIEGGFLPRGLPADALTIATVQTGVGVWALDAATVDGELELRQGEHGRLVVADAAGEIAALFGDPRRPPTRRTRTLLLYAVRVPDVPEPSVEEALELCLELLEE